jgi:hypothetical protein
MLFSFSVKAIRQIAKFHHQKKNTGDNHWILWYPKYESKKS